MGLAVATGGLNHNYQKAFVAYRIGFEEGWNSTKGRIGDPARQVTSTLPRWVYKGEGSHAKECCARASPGAWSGSTPRLNYATMLSSLAACF